MCVVQRMRLVRRSGWEDEITRSAALPTTCSGGATTRRKMLCYYTTVITPCQLLESEFFRTKTPSVESPLFVRKFDSLIFSHGLEPLTVFRNCHASTDG